MRLFEYQAKDLFKDYDLPVPFSILAGNVVAVLNATEQVKFPCVLKAQVLAGGRGKAGGIAIVNDKPSAQREAERIFALSIGGEKPSSILVEKSFPHKEEMYLSVTLDRSERSYVVIASKAGGIEVESQQGKVVRKIPLEGIDRKFAAGVASDLGLPSGQASQFVDILLALEKLAREKECDLAEINPLAIGPDGKVVPLDAKVILDDNALFRHPEFSKIHPEDEFEGQASKEGFAFVRLEGDVAVVGNGAGLVLSTLDLVGDAGGKAACFLDLGGGAQKERVEKAVSLVNKLPNASRILVNIFGGITRTTEVAEGINDVLSRGSVKPIFARISGAEEEEAKKLLQGTQVKLYRTAQEAVEAAVRAR